MLRFFSKMRYKLAAENRVAKYMRYAIGEILLVVIGILIALSINNWNTNKQETRELHGYLKNIKSNLQADLMGIKEMKAFRDSSISWSINYLNIAKKDIITTEDFNAIAIENGGFHVVKDNVFETHNSGFEALKNSGFIGKLNGTELEKMLNEYYYIQKRINDSETSFNNNLATLENNLYNENIMQQIGDIYFMQNKKEYINANQKKIKVLLNHPSLTGATQRNTRTKFLIRDYEQLEELANAIISEINLEIGG